MGTYAQRSRLGFADRWQDLFPSASSWIVPGDSHFPMCDDPTGYAGRLRAGAEAHDVCAGTLRPHLLTRPGGRPFTCRFGGDAAAAAVLGPDMVISDAIKASSPAVPPGNGPNRGR
jgi:hypothetical protein